MGFRTLSRIQSAEYDAQRMRLPGTAERLKILRREMERFHEYSGELLLTKKKWALAKLEDIERTLVREKGQITDEDKAHFDTMRSVSGLAKTIIYLGTTAFAMDMLKRVAGGTMADIGIVLGMSAAAAIMLSRLVEDKIGGNFERVSSGILKALAECKDAFRQR